MTPLWAFIIGVGIAALWLTMLTVFCWMEYFRRERDTESIENILGSLRRADESIETRAATKQAELANAVAERLAEIETRLTEIEGRLGGRLIARVPSMREIQDRAEGRVV